MEQNVKNTHWRKIMNTEYLNGDEITDQVVIIKSFEERNFYSPKSKQKEDHVVLFFNEIEKPMILTNRKAKQISRVLGTPYMAEWTGKSITIFPHSEKHFGEVFQVINIKAGKKAKKNFDNKSPNWEKAIESLKAGTTTLEAIQKHYTMSKATLKEINTILKVKK